MDEAMNDNEPPTQIIEQPMEQEAEEPIDQPIEQETEEPIDQPMDQETDRRRYDYDDDDDFRNFSVGDRLEAVDRKNPTLVCVATVIAIDEQRGDDSVCIHFDGWTDSFDYWARPDSNDLRPQGWCERNGVTLQKPKGYDGDFTWAEYLDEISDAPKLSVGMKLEAVDRANPSFVCVATIHEIDKSRHPNSLLIHLDGWPSHLYDYWASPNSEDLHPPGWCESNGVTLSPPRNYNGLFTWKGCFEVIGKSAAAPVELLTHESNINVPSFNEIPRFQWSSKVVGFSSEFDSRFFNAMSILGSPKFGSYMGVWAPKEGSTGIEFVEVGFKTPIVFPSPKPVFISVLEVDKPGSIIKIAARESETHPWVEVFDRNGTMNQHLIIEEDLVTILAVEVKAEDGFALGQVRVEIDKSLIEEPQPSQPEPELKGVCIGDPFHFPKEDGFRQTEDKVINPEDSQNNWVTEILGFSSQYNETTWGANQIIGMPKVFPRYGDIHGAWAPRPSKNSLEFVELRFENATFAGAMHHVRIYETYNPGAIVKISVRKRDTSHPLASNPWETVWSRKDEQGPRALVREKSRIFEPAIQPVDFSWTDLRIDMDCHGQRSWSEIDAVCVVTETLNINISSKADCTSSLLTSTEDADLHFDPFDMQVWEAEPYDLKRAVAKQLGIEWMVDREPEEFSLKYKESPDAPEVVIDSEEVWFSLWKGKDPYARVDAFKPELAVEFIPLTDISVYIDNPFFKNAPFNMQCAIGNEGKIGYLQRKFVDITGQKPRDASGFGWEFEWSSQQRQLSLLSTDSLIIKDEDLDLKLTPHEHLLAPIGRGLLTQNDDPLDFPPSYIEVRTLDGSSHVLEYEKRSTEIVQHKRDIEEEIFETHPGLQDVDKEEVEFSPSLREIDKPDVYISARTKLPIAVSALFTPMERYSIELPDFQTNSAQGDDMTIYPSSVEVELNPQASVSYLYRKVINKILAEVPGLKDMEEPLANSKITWKRKEIKKDSGKLHQVLDNKSNGNATSDDPGDTYAVDDNGCRVGLALVLPKRKDACCIS